MEFHKRVIFYFVLFCFFGVGVGGVGLISSRKAKLLERKFEVEKVIATVKDCGSDKTLTQMASQWYFSKIDGTR